MTHAIDPSSTQAGAVKAAKAGVKSVKAGLFAKLLAMLAKHEHKAAQFFDGGGTKNATKSSRLKLQSASDKAGGMATLHAAKGKAKAAATDTPVAGLGATNITAGQDNGGKPDAGHVPATPMKSKTASAKPQFASKNLPSRTHILAQQIKDTPSRANGRPAIKDPSPTKPGSKQPNMPPLQPADPFNLPAEPRPADGDKPSPTPRRQHAAARATPKPAADDAAVRKTIPLKASAQPKFQGASQSTPRTATAGSEHAPQAGAVEKTAPAPSPLSARPTIPAMAAKVDADVHNPPQAGAALPREGLRQKLQPRENSPNRGTRAPQQIQKRVAPFNGNESVAHAPRASAFAQPAAVAKPAPSQNAFAIVPDESGPSETAGSAGSASGGSHQAASFHVSDTLASSRAGTAARAAAPQPSGAWTPPAAMQEIARAAGQGRMRLELKLEPEHLGKIKVFLDSGADKQIQMHMVVEQATSRQAIEQHLPMLRQALAQQGLDLGHFSMSAQQHQQREAPQQQTPSSGEAAYKKKTEQRHAPAPASGPGRLSIRV